MLDAYELKARVAPAAVVLSPILVAVIYPALTAASIPELGVGSGTILGALFVLSQFGRGIAKRKERQLFIKWGGKPSTMILRHDDGKIDRLTKARIHQKLEERIGIKFPNPDEERRNPAQADEVYRSATAWLRENTREHASNRLTSELASYGFKRGLLSLKPLGVLIAGATLLIELLKLTQPTPASTPDWFLELSGVWALGVLFVLIAIVTESWVKAQAESYAIAVVSAAEAL